MACVYQADVELPVPVERAWSVLVDFEAYGSWNRFTSDVRADLAMGRWVRMRVHLGRLTLIQYERICALEPPRRIDWELPGPRWLLYARRTQTLEPTERGCRYSTTDTIEGLLAPLVERLFGDALREGFLSVAERLHDAVECQFPSRN